MERVSKHVGERLPPASLHREDIEGLYQAFREVSEKVEIEAGGYRFGGLDDLFAHDSRSVDGIEFSIHDPYVSLTVSRESNPWLYSSNDDVVSLGLCSKVRELLARCRVPLSSWPFRSFGLLAGYVVLMAGVIVFAITARIHRAFWPALAAIVIGPSWSAFSWYTVAGRRCRVSLLHRSAAPNFIRRNRDAFIVGVVTAIVGTAIGTLVTLLLLGRI